jgi:hypothetical protein
MIFRISLVSAILACLTFTPAATHNHLEPTTTLPDRLQSTSSFYSFRRDLRRCASPRCGGYFVNLVNESRTRCADGRFQTDCYVASIDWNGQSEPSSDRGLLRGSILRRGKFGEFRVSEVWQAASSNQPTGTFFRVRDLGIRCIAAPCATHHEARLNSTVSRDVAGVDLAGANAPDNLLSEATAAMTTTDGIIASGVHTLVTGPAGRSQMLKATQFYLRAAKSAGKSTGTDTAQKPCRKTGCSGQVCSDREVITTCEYAAEYACYKKAACERQASGDCGFTQTPELAACLRRNR